MNELLHSVKSIYQKSEGLLSSYNKESYNIPLYQRGFKWTSKQVIKLLEDINNFTPSHGKFYCVQNITLVPSQEKHLNVVDGQQRLITMALILSALNEKELVRNKVKFPENSIRKQSNLFLNDYVTNTNENILDKYPVWEDFIAVHQDFDFQDIYYLYHALLSITEWLKEKNKEAFKEKLLNHVKFIVNYIEGNNEEKIFGNLNSKRIFLDGADLIRAILITRVTDEESKKQSDIKNIVRVNERRVRIGWQLDEINNWWSNTDVQRYFTPWIKIKSTGDIEFSIKKHPINRLFALVLESENKTELSLEIIEEYNSALDLYRKINKLHETLKDWFNDKEIYHYLGFLFAQKRTKKDFDFHKIWTNWSGKYKSRAEFKSYLLSEIKFEIFGEDSLDYLFGKSKNWYEGDNKTLVQILLLLDIIEANKDYKDKLQSHAFFKKDNDIEHIFPQNPKKIEDKAAYISFIVKYDKNLEKEEILNNFELKKEDEDYLKKLDTFLENYTKEIPIHSIGNLVLLYSSLNRSISNQPYAFKRRKVLQYFNEGNYIQPHSLKVFARYFQDENTNGMDLEHWTKSDIEANENSIKETLSSYFKNNL